MDKMPQDVIEHAKLINETLGTLFGDETYALLCEYGLFTHGKNLATHLALTLKLSPEFREAFTVALHVYMTDLNDMDFSNLGVKL